MALRTRLFLFFGSLIAVLVSAELWLVRTLVDDLEEEVGEFALEMGSGFLHFLGAEEPELPATAAPRSTRHAAVHEREPARPPTGADVHLYRGAFVLRLREREIVTAGPELLLVDGGHLAAHLDLSALGLSELHRELARRRDPVQRRFVERVLDDDRRLLRGRNQTAPESLEHLGSDDVAVQIVVKSDGLFTGSEEDSFFEFQMSRSSGHWVEQEAVFELEERAGAPGATVGWGAPASATGTANAPALASARIPMPRHGLVRAVESFLSRLLLGSAGILVLGLLVAGYTAHRVSEPLQGLARAARRVGEGDLGTQVPSEGDREVRETISAFNAMSTQLAALDHEARGLREREHLHEIGEVARGLAHSLRNPLNVLGLTVEQLAGAEGELLAASARAQIQRIDRTLRTFLSLSSGGGDAQVVAVDDIARDVALELVQDSAARATVRVEADGPVPLRAVGPELRAVVHVLVVNAVEASPAGAQVLVRVTPVAGGARVDVLDRGPGLALEVRERLFTPHTTTKEQGAGMGLYLAERIARTRYGGSLTLDARPDGGTRAVLVVASRGEDARG
jgi:signal transduction histidine kinase